MQILRRRATLALALTFAALTSACSSLLPWHQRQIFRHNKLQTGTQVLLSATRDSLNARINNLYNAISSFQATVDMTPSVGSVYQGKITEIKDIQAFVLFRKPMGIRIIGLLPVIRSKAFDMVSDGGSFRFFLNSKNLFVEGDNNAPAVSENKIENLRPDAFLSSMLIRPADPAAESIMIEDSTDEDTAIYELLFVRKNAAGNLYLARNVWFDRLDLSIVRQKVLDEEGVIISDTRYSKWQIFNGVVFPNHIDINRPKDGYGVVMDMTKMEMNKEITNQQLELTQPPGSQLKVIGTSAAGKAEPRP